MKKKEEIENRKTKKGLFKYIHQQIHMTPIYFQNKMIKNLPFQEKVPKFD